MNGAADTSGAEQSPFRLLAPHWRVVLAAWLGWFCDAFDQMVLIFLLVRLGQEFHVGLVAMGLVLTVQSIGRVIGNTAWGWASDRWGRKLAFLVGVIWFAVFSGLSGLAWSYGALLVIQGLFGIGFGGEWTASAALLMESVPDRARSVASALMMAGYEFGYFAAAVANAVVRPHFGWRAMFFIGIVPAVLALFIRWGIPESPVWLAAQHDSRAAAARPKFRLTYPALQGWLLMAFLQFQNTAIFAFYPAFLQQVHHFAPSQVFVFAAVYSVASIIGKPLCGWIASRLGNKRTMLGYFAVTIPGALLFTMTSGTPAIAAGAFVMGIVANSLFALVPDFLSRRFGSANRSFGMGFGYALAALGQAAGGYVVPALAGFWGLATAMAALIIGGSIVAAIIVAAEPAALPGDVMERGDGLSRAAAAD
jgi:SHS family lactate transporter-like MFS transporter